MQLGKSLTVFEHANIPIAWMSSSAVSPREADLLTALAQRRRGFCDRGASSIRLAQYCGVVALGDRSLEVLPKTYREAQTESDHARVLLLRMLRDSKKLKISRDHHVGHSVAEGPLLEVFAASFLDEVRAVVRGGLQRRYVSREDDLGVVRGRIDIRRQVTNLANRPDWIACRFDELLEDNAWNRVIKAAITQLRSCVGRQSLTRRCAEMLTAFVDVADIRTTAASSADLPVDRLFDRYRGALDWAKLILAALTPSVRAGTEEAAGLLFDMNKLFEEVMGRKLIELSACNGLAVELQSHRSFLGTCMPDGERAFKIKPDIIVRSGLAVACVADTKWKLLEPNRSGRFHPSEGDVYQAHAYANVLDVDHVALIYPWHSGLGDVSSAAYSLQNRGRSVKLSVLFIDVESAGYRLRDGRSVFEGLGLKSHESPELAQ